MLKKLLSVMFKASIFITLISIIFSCSNSGKNKDMILILDTSLSMIGKAPGAKPILPQVKKSLPSFIDQLDKNDSITLITFDSEVKVYPTIYVYDKKNKDSIIEFVNGVEASGKWTFTRQMIDVALKKAQELELSGKNRQKVIIAMTDALDDPPPGKRADHLNIKDIAKSYKDKEWFIFFLDFSGQKQKESKQLAEMKKDLKTVSKYTEVIKTDIPSAESGKKTGKKTSGPKTKEEMIAKSIESDLTANIEKMSVQKSKDHVSLPIVTILIVLLIIAAILLIIYFLKRFSGVKVTGKLEYWDHTMLTPYFEKFDLTKQEKKEILIGKKTAFNLTIREIEITNPVKITAVRVGKEIKNILHPGQGYEIEYINRDAEGYLNNGDMFKIANFSFKYIAD